MPQNQPITLLSLFGQVQYVTRSRLLAMAIIRVINGVYFLLGDFAVRT